MITDNALIAFECVHSIQTAKDEGYSFCAYKLDLSKAYGRVDWDFLQGVMSKLGFHCDWIRWVLRCVTSVRYAVRFSGASHTPFTLTRGLRSVIPLFVPICR